VTFYWLGRFADSRRHLEQALARYDPTSRHIHLELYAQDPRAVCLCRLAWTLWFLGFPDQAMARMAEALAWARELGHPHTQGYVLYFSAQLALDARAEARAEELLLALIQLTERHPLYFWEFRGRILSGFLRASRTGSREAFEESRTHMAAYARVGNLVNFSQFLGLAADLKLKQGNLAEGRTLIAEAFELLQKIDERYFTAELHRIEGELRVADSSPSSTAETCFENALRISREQGSKSLELRAAMSLARFWRNRGESTRAREILQPIFLSFSEGLTTPDLVDARTLLNAR